MPCVMFELGIKFLKLILWQKAIRTYSHTHTHIHTYVHTELEGGGEVTFLYREFTFGRGSSGWGLGVSGVPYIKIAFSP